MAEVNLHSWPEISQAADGLQLNPTKAMLEQILATLARLELKLDERDRRLGTTIPPPRPEPDPPDGPPLYVAAQPQTYQSTYHQPHQPYTPQPYTPELYFHNHQPVYQQHRQAPQFDIPYPNQGPTPYVAPEPYNPLCNPYVEYQPWQQDQLVYRPPPPTEWPPPPPQSSPSCWSPTNSHRQSVSGLKQSVALHQPLPNRPSTCKSLTSHCRPEAPLPAAAVIQPLNLAPPTAISLQCYPNSSPALVSDVVLAAVVPSSLKEEISEGGKYQFGDCYSSLFEERKANGEIHKFDDIFILDEGGQHRIAICNVVVAKIGTTSLIFHILEHDWICNDQTNFKDIFDADHFIQFLKTVSRGNYNWIEQFYAFDPGGATSRSLLVVVTWFPPPPQSLLVVVTWFPP